MSHPTEQVYRELQLAYDHFNKELFNNRLPPCLMTLQRKSSTRGYFSAARFVNHEGDKMDELAMNPEYFPIYSIEENLSVVLHEMVHKEIYLSGKHGRGRYHNKAWADRMEDLGLMPSATAQPGGARTGDRMSHYIVEGGPFQLACRDLITREFRLSWMDRFPPQKAVQSLARRVELERCQQRSEPAVPKEAVEGLGDPAQNPGPPDEWTPPGNTGAEERLETLRKIGVRVDTHRPQSAPRRPPSNRYKYRCPSCNTNVWGKLGLNIQCADCQVVFENTDM